MGILTKRSQLESKSTQATILNWADILTERCYDLAQELTKGITPDKVLTPSHFVKYHNHEAILETPSHELMINHFAVLFLLDIGSVFD